MLPLLITGAVTLFIGIITGLTKSIPQIISAVIKLIPIIVKALIDAIPMLIDAGFQMLMGLIKGIIENAPRLLANLAKSLGDMLIGGVKSIFGIKSPSREFFSIGGQIMNGLVNGINDGKTELAKTVDSMSNLVFDTFGSDGLNGNISASLSSSPLINSANPMNGTDFAGSAGGGQVVNYYAAPNNSLDAEQQLFTAIKRAKVLAGW
jgi:phage-related protein